MKRLLLSSVASLAISSIAAAQSGCAQSPPYNAMSLATIGGNCTATGAIAYQASGGLTVCLQPGANGNVLTLGGGLPAWGTGTASGTVATGATGGLPYYAGAGNALSALPAGTNGYVLTLTGGLPSWAASSPVYGSQTANTVLAAPNGSAGAPGFRSIAAADLPAIGGGNVSCAAGGACTIAPNVVTNALLAQSGGLTFKGNATGATANVTDFSAQSAESILPYQASGTGSVPRLLDAKIKDYVISAIDFGADPTGTADSAAAINAAITALPAAGGDVLLPRGTYKITSTINIGNGSASAQSTTNGIRLIAYGAEGPADFFTGYSANAASFKWAGASGGTMISVNGPIQGWGLQNIALNCVGANTAGYGVLNTSGRYGMVESLSTQGCSNYGVKETTIAPFGSITNTDAIQNTFKNLSILVPSGAAGALALTSIGTTANVDFNTFQNISIAMAGSTSKGIYLQGAAGNLFLQTQISGITGDTDISFDYTLGAGWPANNMFFVIEAGSGGDTLVANTGTPGTATANYLYGLITTDGTPYPNLLNLVTDGGQFRGAQDGSGANAGNIGEIITSTVTSGSPITLTSTTAANVTNITLTPGDWDVTGTVCINGAVATMLQLAAGGISAASAALPAIGGAQLSFGATGLAVFNESAECLTVGQQKFQLATSAPIYLVALSQFSASTANAYGTITARRRR